MEIKTDTLKKLEEQVQELEDILNSKTDSILEHEEDKNLVVQKLRCLGKELLTKYEVRVGNITIEPLRIEPYLFKEKVFEDKFIHKEPGIYGPCQRDRFGKLYIHKGYGGVDIVLSENKNYALSFLIKNSRILIGGNIVYPFVKQYRAAEVLKENGIPTDYDGIALFEKEKHNNSVVFNTVRNGLTKIKERDDFTKEQQAKYNLLIISSFIELKEHTSQNYNFEKGYGGDRAVVEYLKDYKTKHPDVSVEELDKMRKKLYPNGSRTEFIKEFGN